MNSTQTKPGNINLSNRLERLQRKIQALQIISQRFSIYRMVIFAIGVLVTWLASSLLGSTAAWLIFGIAVGVFSGVVWKHHNLEKWIHMFQTWHQLYLQQLARSELNWDHLPYRSLPETRIRTPLDIDLDLTGPRSLHHLIDQSISDKGSMQLADWLCHPEPDIEKIHNRQTWVKELTNCYRFGMRLQLIFRLASKEKIRGDQILSWLRTEVPYQRLRWSLPIATVLALLTFGLFLGNAIINWPPYWIISALVYLSFYNFTGRENAEILDQVAILDTELGKLKPVFQYLEKASFTCMPAINDLCKPFHQSGETPSELLRKLKWITAAVGLRMNPIMGFLLNIFLPWDYFWTFLAIRARKRLSKQLPNWLDRLYLLEVITSLADFSRSQTGICFPEINSSEIPFLQVEQLTHPLLVPHSRITNDFILKKAGEAALITGSNMAGKSTFIKAIGVNVCLAYAGSAVMAQKWTSSLFRLHSCIRISDSISDGFSYFYAEVKCLSSLLQKLKEPTTDDSKPFPVLYLIDEIFRGTNNRERLTGSKAYLQSAIQGNGSGIIATHDLELASLADQHPTIKNFHFRDHVINGRLVFDYKIRDGSSPTTNALRIMAMEGLPVELENRED